jgi:hypothetical protein
MTDPAADEQLLANRGVLQVDRVAQGIREAASDGVAVCRGALSRPWTAQWAEELSHGVFTEVNHPDASVREEYESYSITSIGPPQVPLTADLAAALSALVESELPGQHWAPNEVVVQRYRAYDSGISAHRDFSRNRLIVVICTVAGSGQFEHVGPPPLHPVRHSWTVEEGDVVILRAHGLGDPDAERPYHRVIRSKGHRLAATFRHNAH